MVLLCYFSIVICVLITGESLVLFSIVICVLVTRVPLYFCCASLGMSGHHLTHLDPIDTLVFIVLRKIKSHVTLVVC